MSTGAGITVGVEEEFLLVNAKDGTPSERAAAVLARATRTPPPGAPGALCKAELLTTQVEAASGVCVDLAGLRAQIESTRKVLAAAADEEGARVAAVGYPWTDVPPVAVSEGKRYGDIADAYAAVATDYQACGCHVHVGVPEPETAVAVVNHLRPWLATLLALTVNSPFAAGRDTGYGSWRSILQSRFPGFGVPPWFPDARAYEAELERRAALGLVMDTRMTFWMARPSRHLPTVEVRVADVQTSVDAVILHAALVRGLVRRALGDLALGREAPRIDGVVTTAGVWTAARHGLDGPGVDPFTERRVPARRLVADLLAHIREPLADLGDLEEVRRLLDVVDARGTGARRQRAAYAAGGLPAVAAGVTL